MVIDGKAETCLNFNTLHIILFFFCRLPYLEAVIAETMRANIIAPLTVARKATEDTTFYNYNVPKVRITNAKSKLI